MKKLPTIYKLTETEAVQQWTIVIDGNSYYSCEGIVGGLITQNKPTFCEGKNLGKTNETSGEEQALKEAQAKRDKKLKTGYHQDIKNINKGTKYVECMLAKSYGDYSSKIDFKKEKWAIQVKFNGNRCVATKEGLFTRKGENYVATPHIESSLKSFFQKHPNAVLDGEMANYELRQQLNELNKLIRRTVNITDDDLKKSEKMVKFYIYDGYGFGDLEESASYDIRKEWIDKNIIGKYDYIEEVKSYPISCEKDLNEKYNSFIDDGEEGAILRKMDEGYQHKRTKFLLKVKPEDDDEAVILDIIEGKGNWTGTGKTITLKWQGKQFDATFKGTQEQGTQFLKDKKKWIGKEVTFLYNGLTGLGTPNYARMDIDNCLKR